MCVPPLPLPSPFSPLLAPFLLVTEGFYLTLGASGTLGNAVCDAMLYSRWAVGARHVDFAMHNSGGIRATIPAPNITQGVLVTAFPFQNGIVDLELTGAELWDIFEGIASGVNKAGKVRSSIRVSFLT